MEARNRGKISLSHSAVSDTAKSAFLALLQNPSLVSELPLTTQQVNRLLKESWHLATEMLATYQRSNGEELRAIVLNGCPNEEVKNDDVN